jgi:hypothetical protein
MVKTCFPTLELFRPFLQETTMPVIRAYFVIIWALFDPDKTLSIQLFVRWQNIRSLAHIETFLYTCQDSISEIGTKFKAKAGETSHSSQGSSPPAAKLHEEQAVSRQYTTPLFHLHFHLLQYLELTLFI